MQLLSVGVLIMGWKGFVPMAQGDIDIEHFSEEPEKFSGACHPELCLTPWHSGDFSGNFCGKQAPDWDVNPGALWGYGMVLCLGHTFKRTDPASLGVSASLANVLGKACAVFHWETSTVFIPPMGNLEDIQATTGC